MTDPPALPALTAEQEATLARLLAADLDASAPGGLGPDTSHADGAPGRGRPDGRGPFEDYQCAAENRGRRAPPGRCGQWSVRGDTRCISHGGYPGRLEWEESGRERVQAWLAAVDGARRAAFLAAFAGLGQAPNGAGYPRLEPRPGRPGRRTRRPGR